MDLLTFILDVLGIMDMDDTDNYGAIIWRCQSEYAPITFLVNCNDTFWWGHADCEVLDPEDLPGLKQAIADVRTIDEHESDWGFLLWCARKRGMRPQQLAYPKNPQLRALFDAAGPARSPKDEG